jgi:translation initiation factor 3 subunit A
VKQIEDEKAEIQARLKGVSKRLDHTERAFRKEEISLLERDYVRQRKADRHYYEAARAARIQAAREKHARDLKLKQKMAAIMPDYRKFRAKLEGSVREDYNRHCQEVARQLEKAKKQRIQEYREVKYEVEQRRKAEAAERAQREEQERHQREQREREERERREREEEERREREEREAKERAEREERERKLAEQLEKQRERERLAEEKLAAQRRGISAATATRTEERSWRRSESTTPPPSSSSAGAWRRSESIRRQESPRTETTTTTTTTTTTFSSRAEEGSWRRSDSNPTPMPSETLNSWRSRGPPGVRASQSPRSTDMSRNASNSSTGGAERSSGFLSPRGASAAAAEGNWRARDSPKDSPRLLRASQSANTSDNATPTESRPTASDVDTDGFTLVTKGRGQRR